MSILISKISFFLKEFDIFLIIDALIITFSLIIFFKIFRSKISERKKKLVTAILALIVFLSLNFTLAEAYFRFIYDNSDGLGFLKVSQKWNERHVRVNGDFKRDKEFALQKKEKVTRICAIGDSITFGYGIRDVKDRYTDILEQLLQKDGYKIEIYDLALSGANFLR